MRNLRGTSGWGKDDVSSRLPVISGLPRLLTLISMKLVRLLLPLATLVTYSATPLLAADTVEIKPQWIPGKKYWQTTQSTQSTTVPIGAQKMEQKADSTIEMTATVSKHEDGQQKRVAFKYERSALQMEIAGQKIGFDSAKPGEGTDPLGLAKTFGATVGKELKALFSAKDELVSLENYDEFIKGIGPSPLPGMDTGKLFSRESLTQVIKQSSLMSTPGKPVTTGETWPFSSELEIPSFGKILASGTYTFKGMAQHQGVPCAEIALEGKMTVEKANPDPSSQMGSALAQMNMSIQNSSMKGTLWFDPKLGFVRDSQLIQEMEMTIKNPADPAQALTIPFKQEVSTTLNKVEDAK